MNFSVPVSLLAHAEPIAHPNTIPLELRSIQNLLWHQLQTYLELENNYVVLNLSDTGTGKTLAAYTHLLRQPYPSRTVIVAPTNALVAQHESDAKEFIEKNNLPYIVIGFDAKKAKAIRSNIQKTRPDLAKRCQSNGRLLIELWKDPSLIDESISNTTKLILITNPDIFRLASNFQYGSHEVSLGAEFIGRIDYLIIDETHVYHALQLTSLFFSLLLWSAGLAKNDKRRILLLSATPEKDLKWFINALHKLDVKIACIEPQSAPLDLPRVVSLSPINIEFRELKINECFITAKEQLEILEHKKMKKDMLILSDSLNRINKIANNLKTEHNLNPKKITGMISHSERLKVVTNDLILATPTVDLGFNFPKKENKQFQSIDTIYCEAPTIDRLWQRLGRAGRVLPYEIKDIPSQAFAYIPKQALIKLRTYIESNNINFPMERNKFKHLFKEICLSEMEKPGIEEFSIDLRLKILGWAFAGFAKGLNHELEINAKFKKIVQQIVEIITGKNIPAEIILSIGKAMDECMELKKEFKDFAFPDNLSYFTDEKWYCTTIAENNTYKTFKWLSSCNEIIDDNNNSNNIVKAIKEQKIFANLFNQKLNVQKIYRKVIEILWREACLSNSLLSFRGSQAFDSEILTFDENGLFLNEPDFTNDISILRILKNCNYSVHTVEEFRKKYPEENSSELIRKKYVTVIHSFLEETRKLKIFLILTEIQRNELESEQNFKKINVVMSILIKNDRFDIDKLLIEELNNDCAKNGILYFAPLKKLFKNYDYAKKMCEHYGYFPSAFLDFQEGKNISLNTEIPCWTGSETFIVEQIFNYYG
ncbi:type I-D CRISPR-associated helicase Cas3' [Pigmentibacter sp. JX0631]|uniref:type I-D CRISPR-associated helicase Cas3' n=1 Tax=Pigmentibacter sp. JX0631 TaxID=2976982 RepID=UPI0024691F92|nr:type I-D CRISPR-associated helicase Cas3' [Pigmentibacter sp. JX0631]WGL60031.1 type I-D CRISPR-associated helicase Cas3' [Pigmentibacter sp. JX0631]